MAIVPHISILPVDVLSDSFGLNESHSWQLPLRVADSVFLEDVAGIIEQTRFIWTRYVSEEETKSLKHIRYALVHHFEVKSDRLHERPEDENSRNLLYRLHLGLKIIRPTTARFQVFTFNMQDPVPRTPRWDRNDHGAILCDNEDGLIQSHDIEELAASSSSILRVLNKPTSPVSQAIQSLEIGYRSEWFNVRHLLWIVGLDALFTSIEWENQGLEVAVSRIGNFLGDRFRIYNEDIGLSPPPDTTLGEVLDDMYRLRNNFAHGTWPDKTWAGKVCRQSQDGTRDIHYAEVLAEAASICLRGACERYLQMGN